MQTLRSEVQDHLEFAAKFDYFIYRVGDIICHKILKSKVNTENHVGTHQAVALAAMIQGLKHDRFRDNLRKHPPSMFDQANERSRRFITAEEYALSGKPIVGGMSSNQQKLNVREVKHQNRTQKKKSDEADQKSQPITFTSTDLDGVVTPHDDPLATSVIVNNCEVQRVLVDTGSALNIIHRTSYFDRDQRCRFIIPLMHEVLYAHGSGDSQSSAIKFQLEAPNSQQVIGIELLNNKPENEAKATPVEEVEEVQIDDSDPTKKTQIGTKLSSKERKELIGFLKSNKDVFAWTSVDMPGIPTSVEVHKLSTNPLKKPVAHKRRLFGGERMQAIKEKVQKLLQAGFVKRVDYYEWVANLVLVKKSNGKWRMCIDYTNLNDACPKDCHPLPIHMASEDEVKTSFYAGDEIYCYVMIPFGLKNAGAMYQKMVTIVFQAQIGRNLEVYIDDIVVKSLKAEDHLTNLGETFDSLRKHSKRLNPAKCVFGVKSSKFLGFMVSKSGIEVNPRKIKAIEEMKLPRSVKDVQCLTGQGKILYLNLEISDTTISSVLVREMGQQQKLVYYANKVVQGAELRQILQKPECSSKLIKWAIELDEFHITFQQRSTIRAQALANFVVECEVIDPTLAKYLVVVSELKCQFERFQLTKVPRAKNEHADSLSKLASDSYRGMRSFYVKVLDEPSFQRSKVMEVNVDPETPSWTDPIKTYLRDGTIPNDKLEEMKLRRKTSRYTLVDGILYQRSYSLLLLHYLTLYEVEYTLRKVHKGVCGSHIGAWTLTHKVLRQGYYWPNMQEDANKYV
ncbi:hypothetical protein SLEP1_g46825 [Rubroshorea leprosula]|uniref:Reverse transcriptase domain-containing protein n=1 Tax=Rubroshorea leprosula TaxID=152421 RepID=A0AAV5LQ50_9ROSI|nr:hypothetical protein SLEP1_g46825 [Rubroshorea leprosula]